MNFRLPDKSIGLLSLALALAAFHGFAWCVVFYPGLLSAFLARRKPRERIAWAALWGVVFSLLFYHWVGSYGLLPWLALALVRGSLWGLYPLPVLVWRWLERRRGARPANGQVVDVLGGALGTALVSQALLMGITGVDWETPAALLTGWPELLFALPWIGLSGMALLVGLVSHLFVCPHPRAILVGLSLSLFWIASALTYEPLPEKKLGLNVALVQSGFSQDEKWDRGKREQAVARLLEATEAAAGQGAQLVIWPETAWPYRGMRRRVTNTRKIGKTARTLKVDILASSIEEAPQHDPPGWYNSVSLVRHSGRFAEHYQKTRLAPFAEYIPLPNSWQRWLRTVPPFSDISSFIPGANRALFTTSSGHSFGVMICYESMTPKLAAKLAREVDFLVVVTNDAPFRHSVPNEAHFRSAILRAVQTRRPVLQAANTGVTGAISSQGRVLARTPVGFSQPDVQYVRL